ncbi:uncharacterized protein LOC107617537 isoform X3 [Arachis ipaensis]|uniref:NFATC2-interacting protein n=1 Tax=Arachis hypogaea TaxID=3818 RepID=A0A6B9VGG5_ARAHY|nr:uncharacterized protein LOC107617537 isoform X3 [Arachis ipaensis]XP_025678239.1 uncharacterized protein LOC112778089 isoform X3 [Arachis hypogaea]QHN79711.1 NFATC2-interacting protein [Arachis hypogaea]
MTDDEFADELEPLFDYSRVQPPVISLDDDDDADKDVVPPKKGKTSHDPVVPEKKQTDVKPVPVVDIDDEDDWLPPPPKVSTDAHKSIDEDSTLKKLRLKKQELQDLFKTVEESEKSEICDSPKSSMDDTSEKTSKPAERPKILISIQDKSEKKPVRVYRDDKFERIFKMYAEKLGCDQNKIVLSFDGDKISPSETPDTLGMEDGDMIEVHVKSS